MTDPPSGNTPYIATPSVPAPGEKASIWEDFIDIFYAPSAVLRRRENASFWPPMLFVAIALAVIAFLSANAMQPVLDAEFHRMAPLLLRKYPQLTEEALAKQQQIGQTIQRYGLLVVLPITMFIVGVVTWLVAKLVDSKETLGQATLVVSYAYVPKVLAGVLTAVELLLLDPSRLTGLASISFSPARFLDPDTTSPVLIALLMRLDVFVLWETVILAIGVAVLGQTTRGRAIAAGVLFWAVGAAATLLQALRAA